LQKVGALARAVLELGNIKASADLRTRGGKRIVQSLSSSKSARGNSTATDHHRADRKIRGPNFPPQKREEKDRGDAVTGKIV